MASNPLKSDARQDTSITFPSIQTAVKTLASEYPWTTTPLIVGAPMRVFSGPALAVAISEAGGFGFIGPGENPEHLAKELEDAIALVQKSEHLASHLTTSKILPVGIGIQLWQGDLSVISKILSSITDSHPPAAIWFFAPRSGDDEILAWSNALRSITPRSKIWVQVAGAAEAIRLAHATDAPDVLVLQGADAGGHSRTQGASVLSLVPEVSDALAVAGSHIPLIAAGGIADARGVAAALMLGASGATLGTRLLATTEVRVNAGYQRAVLEGSDGGQTTVRTQLFNHLRGTFGWPAGWDARGLKNASWRDHEKGLPFEENRKLHEEAVKKGEAAWGAENGRAATYAGTSVGLVRDVKPAGDLVKEIGNATCIIMKRTLEGLER